MAVLMKNKIMKTKILFIAIALSFALQLSITAQNTDRYVRVGDTTINLKDVDLEKGMIFTKIRSSIVVDNSLGHNNTQIKTAPIIKKVKPYEITREGKEFNIKLKKSNKNR